MQIPGLCPDRARQKAGWGPGSCIFNKAQNLQFFWALCSSLGPWLYHHQLRRFNVFALQFPRLQSVNNTHSLHLKP